MVKFLTVLTLSPQNLQILPNLQIQQQSPQNHLPALLRLQCTADANEDKKVTVADAVLIMQSLSNGDEYKLTAQGQVNADVVGKGRRHYNADALVIQQVEAKTINQADLPIDSVEE